MIEKVSRGAAGSRHAVALFYHPHGLFGNGAETQPAVRVVDWPRLGAFAGVCYTIWTGSGIV
ncbi:MAG: hypothetical protein DMG46_01020 [Acidobacteria bacterium]|nr:MAG: hypothetical protein DMG46_01020 [Acidobacteriota bacterium]